MGRDAPFAPFVPVKSSVVPSVSVFFGVPPFTNFFLQVWYGAVLRGDKNKIQVGTGANIQDKAVIGTVSELDSGFPAECKIGDYTSVGQGAVLTSCLVGDACSIGAGAIVQAGSVVEKRSMVAAGAVVVSGTLVPSGQLWAGNPAVYVRDLADEEVADFEKNAESLSLLAKEHSEEFLPYGTVYQQAEQL